MEKRKTPRRPITIAIICQRFSAIYSKESVHGEMKNCCTDGFHAELNLEFKPGTVLAVRASGCSWADSIDENSRSQALVEVKWSKTISLGADLRYATGLKYLMPD